MEAQTQEDWRNNITEPKDTLKIAEDEEVRFVFLDEGNKHTHLEYGTSIIFRIKPLFGDGSEKNWYVKSNNYSLLGQIKTLGKLTGLNVVVKRKGSKRSDTRYTIEKIE